ncbi:hypothetical protein L914_13114 [Phytophthora nicotianae]|nr:hypothetical protein L914_13114 [Phytophthora nicotianae]
MKLFASVLRDEGKIWGSEVIAFTRLHRDNAWARQQVTRTPLSDSGLDVARYVRLLMAAIYAAKGAPTSLELTVMLGGKFQKDCFAETGADALCYHSACRVAEHNSGSIRNVGNPHVMNFKSASSSLYG